jgi:hypothetical protein
MKKEETFAETMPSEMGYDYAAMSFQEKKAQEGVPPSVIFGVSLLFVFLILAALHESWTLPFSVLLRTPVAVFGAFAALWARGLENNVYAQIGLVMLIGLAAKNAILIVEFAKLSYERGTPLLEAALEGARLRLRPIIMISFAFILGCLPLWGASGSGAVARRVMGTTVIGGMLAATLIAISSSPRHTTSSSASPLSACSARRRECPLTRGGARPRCDCSHDRERSVADARPFGHASIVQAHDNDIKQMQKQTSLSPYENPFFILEKRFPLVAFRSGARRLSHACAGSRGSLGIV